LFIRPIRGSDWLYCVHWLQSWAVFIDSWGQCLVELHWLRQRAVHNRSEHNGVHELCFRVLPRLDRIFRISGLHRLRAGPIRICDGNHSMHFLRGGVLLIVDGVRDVGKLHGMPCRHLCRLAGNGFLLRLRSWSVLDRVGHADVDELRWVFGWAVLVVDGIDRMRGMPQRAFLRRNGGSHFQ
jgi:hypothetical protein